MRFEILFFFLFLFSFELGKLCGLLPCFFPNIVFNTINLNIIILFCEVVRTSNMKNSNYACIIPEKLYFGNGIMARNEEELKKIGINVIIDLIDYIKEEDKIKHSNDFEVIHYPIADQPDNNINWAEKISNLMKEKIDKSKTIYVHCVMGMSRSAALILYYLIRHCGKTFKQAFEFVKSVRPILCPTFGFMTGLNEIDVKVNGTSSFSLDDYAIKCLSENFPKFSIEEITTTYNQAKEEVKKNPNVCEPIKIKEHIAPVGYLCFELLKKKYGNNPIMRRDGCCIHHPF